MIFGIDVASMVLGGLAAGMVLFIVNGFLSTPEHWLMVSGFAVFSTVMFFAIWKANERAADRLQKQIDALDKQS